MDRVNDDRDNVLDELSEIEEWSARMTPLPACQSNDDYMTIAVELMVRTTMLLTFAASLAPDEATLRDGITKRRAIVLGLLVRMRKLCHALLMHVVEKQRDLCTIFDRLILETETKMTYLMAARQSSFRNFVQISFKPEREMLKDLKQKRATRKLEPIKKRMLSGVQRNLGDERNGFKQLAENKKWEQDCKNFREQF